MNTLKVGEKAPHFSGTDQNGTVIDLENLKGQKVVLYFYPKDDTPGCTAEACSLRDNYEVLMQKGFKVIGVSPDNLAKHQKFAEKYHLPFSILPDPDKEIIMKYGVWGEKKFMGKAYMGVLRTTFVIDENGLISEIITKVDTKNHADQILG